MLGPTLLGDDPTFAIKERPSTLLSQPGTTRFKRMDFPRPTSQKTSHNHFNRKRDGVSLTSLFFGVHGKVYFKLSVRKKYSQAKSFEFRINVIRGLSRSKKFGLSVYL
jgi:hypothetical protein